MKEEALYIDHLNSRLVLQAPKKKNISAATQLERRLYYLGQLLRQVEAMRTIGVAHVFLTIRPEGRERMRKRRKKVSP